MRGGNNLCLRLQESDTVHTRACAQGSLPSGRGCLESRTPALGKAPLVIGERRARYQRPKFHRRHCVVILLGSSQSAVFLLLFFIYDMMIALTVGMNITILVSSELHNYNSVLTIRLLLSCDVLPAPVDRRQTQAKPTLAFQPQTAAVGKLTPSQSCPVETKLSNRKITVEDPLPRVPRPAIQINTKVYLSLEKQ